MYKYYSLNELFHILTDKTLIKIAADDILIFWNCLEKKKGLDISYDLSARQQRQQNSYCLLSAKTDITFSCFLFCGIRTNQGIQWTWYTWNILRIFTNFITAYEESQ